MSILSQPISILGLGQNRKIETITVQVVLNETTNDTLVVTKQPVQTGAPITDHSYKEPTTLSMQVLFQDNLLISLSKIYQQLIELQNRREPFAVLTPKRLYTSMLMTVLGQTTDKRTENILAIGVTFQQVILVNVAATTQAPRSRQANPGNTGATQPSGKKSALFILGGG